MGAARKEREPQFTVPEASAILGLSPKHVNNALERELATLHLAKTSGGSRSVSEKGLIALVLVRAFAKLFTPQMRQVVIREAVRSPSDDSISVQKGCVVVRIAEYREKVDEGKARLQRAKDIVVSDPEILSGEPCVRGTRVPVYLVGALARKHGAEAARNTYPSLTREQVELAALYVTANPRKGRPPQAPLSKPKGSAKRGRSKKFRLEA
jgi:uncharacterized protein (DUF433 family)